MLNMSVQIDINSLHVYESGGIIGAICVDADGVKFPSADWTDFVFAIVHNWLREIRNIALLKEQKVELVFFDGPYRIRIKNESGVLSSFDFIRSASSKEVITLSDQFELKLFCDNLIEISKMLIEWSNVNNISNSDILGIIDNLRDVTGTQAFGGAITIVPRTPGTSATDA